MLVKFFATLRRLTGEKECFVEHTGTLEGLLRQLCDRYGSTFASQIFLNGEVHPDVIILVDGRAIEHLAGKETVLTAEHTIAIFPRIAGG